MNVGYAVSDAVLAAVCFVLAVRSGRARPGLAMACAAIGSAATVGVLRFAGVEQAAGPHRFLSLIGSTAAMPLLAASLSWPRSESATTGRGAALSLLVGSALGLAITVGAGFKLWAQAVPALSALAILVACLKTRNGRRIAGAVLLVATFALVAANVSIAGLASLEILHYGMAAALLLFCF